MTTPRQDIVDASGLIGLLLVFVFGYFAAALPSALSLLEQPRPDIAKDRSALATRLRSYSIVVAIVLTLGGLVFMWLLPLTAATLNRVTFSANFPTLEVGLLLMDVMLLSLLIVAGWLLVHLRRRRRDLQGTEGTRSSPA